MHKKVKGFLLWLVILIIGIGWAFLMNASRNILLGVSIFWFIFGGLVFFLVLREKDVKEDGDVK